MILLDDIVKTYGFSQKKVALNHVSLAFPRGEIVGLFGENGAGKTTLLKCILGLLPHKGSITLDSQAIGRKEVASLAFATCEHSFFPALSANAHREYFSLQFPKFRQKRFDGLMEFFQLPHKKPLRSFSTGQKNQFEVILALCQGADYILMDEPFAGNDLFNREDFYKVLLGILEPEETVILSTHLIEEVSNFIGRAVLIGHGSILGDTTTEALEEQGISLTDFVKSVYGYQSDRVSKALQDLTEEEI